MCMYSCPEINNEHLTVSGVTSATQSGVCLRVSLCWVNMRSHYSNGSYVTVSSLSLLNQCNCWALSAHVIKIIRWCSVAAAKHKHTVHTKQHHMPALITHVIKDTANGNFCGCDSEADIGCHSPDDAWGVITCSLIHRETAVCDRSLLNTARCDTEISPAVICKWCMHHLNEFNIFLYDRVRPIVTNTKKICSLPIYTPYITDSLSLQCSVKLNVAALMLLLFLFLAYKNPSEV